MRDGIWSLIKRTPHIRSTALVLAGLILVLGIFLNRADAPDEGRAARRAARERKADVQDYAQVYLWNAAAINAAVLGMVLLSAPWWLRVVARPGVRREPTTEGAPFTKGTFAALGIALVAASWLRVPQMDRMIYFDEQDTLRRSIHGYHHIRDGGEAQWEPVAWRDAFWENRHGNNPVLFSILGRASMQIWQKLSGSGEERYSLAAIRLPSLVAGLASIVAIWWLGHLLGSGWAGGFAAVLAAVHPLHIDYSIQARGYGLVLLFSSLALIAACKALDQNRWRYWIALAACLFACLWSYAGAAYLAMGIAICIATVMGYRWLVKKEPSGSAALGRFGITNLFGGLLFFQLMAPALAQLRESFESGVWDRWTGVLDATWLTYTWGEYASGVLVPGPDAVDRLEGKPASELWTFMTTQYAKAEPVLTLLEFAIIPALAVWGVVAVWRKAPQCVAVFAAYALAAALAFFANRAPDRPFIHYWYIIYVLPVLVMLLSVAIGSIGGRKPTVSTVVGTAFLGVFVWQTLLPGPGRNRLDYGKGEPYVEFKRGPDRYVMFPTGTMVRESPGEKGTPPPPDPALGLRGAP